MIHDVFVLDQTHVVKSLFGKTVWTWFAEPAHGSGWNKGMRRSGSCVPVTHVRYGSSRRTGLQRVVGVSDDRRVCVFRHARAGGTQWNCTESPDRRLYRSKKTALEIWCRGELIPRVDRSFFTNIEKLFRAI